MGGEGGDDMTLSVKFLDRGREPRCPPDPDFPAGRVIDLTDGASACCAITLDGVDLYPAPRCGLLLVTCSFCKANALVTTAGRVDDPRTIKLGCAPSRTAH